MHSTGFCVPCTVAMYRRHVLGAGADGPQRGLVPRALPVARRALAHRVEAGFVLPVVVAAPEHQPRLGPDDLAADDEARRLQAFDDGARVHARMPDVGHVAGE